MTIFLLHASTLNVRFCKMTMPYAVCRAHLRCVYTNTVGESGLSFSKYC